MATDRRDWTGWLGWVGGGCGAWVTVTAPYFFVIVGALSAVGGSLDSKASRSQKA